jgi:hypothetical protein
MMNFHEIPSEEDIDSDEDEELDEDELNGIMNEEKIKQFNDILFEAQEMALKAEHEARSTYLIYHPSAMQTVQLVHGLGLTGPEAAWANRKYHGHRALPPDMALKLKKEHERKYNGQEK